MPKTFPIVIDVEEIAVGRVMRLLNKTQGIAKLHLDLDRDKKPPKQFTNGEAHPRQKRRGRFEVSGDDAIVAILGKKAPLTSTQIAAAFAAQGRSPKSISSCLHKLRVDGLINSTHEGYSLTKKARDRLRHRKKG